MLQKINAIKVFKELKFANECVPALNKASKTLEEAFRTLKSADLNQISISSTFNAEPNCGSNSKLFMWEFIDVTSDSQNSDCRRKSES